MIVTHKHIDQHLKTITEPRLSQIKQLIDMMSKVTQRTPEMWGSIIGFGSVHYTYASGLSGDMPILGINVNIRMYNCVQLRFLTFVIFKFIFNSIRVTSYIKQI